MRIKRELKFALALLLFSLPLLAADATGRFFIEGDGIVRLVNAKRGQGGEIRYRLPDGTYDEKAEMGIRRIFGAPPDPFEGISLRLVSLLDYLQDHFKGKSVRIVSGYRSPEYNEGLRKKGKLAAKTSLHLEGMAADIEIPGIDGRDLWEYLRQLDCCGAGFYHGKGIHIDTGPSRFWDEKTTGVEKDLGAHNKLILARTGRDIYRPGETVEIRLARITDYPLQLSREFWVKKGWQTVKAYTLNENSEASSCLPVGNRKERIFHWTIPADFHPKDKVSLEFKFCEKPFSEMPDKIESNPVLILP